MKESGIYKIVNLVNGKIYVGSAVNMGARWRRHKSDLTLNRHHSIKLQRSWNKHGANNFKHETIETCEKEILIEREQHYIDLYNSVNNGYNVYSFPGSPFGYKHSEETKNKMSIDRLKMKRKLSDESKNKCRIAKIGNKYNVGRKHSNLSRTNMSKSKFGKLNPNYNPTQIIQYDLNDNFIKEWQDLISLKEAGFGSYFISSVCKLKRNHAYGYKWKFKS